jgi:Galactose oxidase, central domain
MTIPGRGGATLQLLSTSETHHTLLLLFGASRVENHDDIWLVNVNRANFKVETAERVQAKERDGLTSRNSMVSARLPEGKRVALMGGQDSETGTVFNDIYVYDDATKSFSHHVYGEGLVTPAPRNSHTLAQAEGSTVAYLFGGADNESGPKRDLYKFDLATREFRVINTVDTEGVKLPYIEMHTSHVYKGSKLLIIGGRGYFPGQKIEQTLFHDEIYSVDLDEASPATYGHVSLFGRLPADIGSHQTALIDDKYIVLYGGTNGLRFFDSILRYSIEEKKWTLMTKQPPHLKGSRFFQDGRISLSLALCLPDLLVMFGGSSFEKECNDWLVVPLAWLRDDANFSEINEIM